MYYFSDDTRTNVIEVLKHIPVHDSVYIQNQFNKTEKEWKVVLYNAIYNVDICIIFKEVCFALTTDFDVWGTNNAVLSLTLENDYTFLTPLLENVDKINEDECLYFLFQSFSGNEMHIICKTAFCEIREHGAIMNNQNTGQNTGDGSLIVTK